MTSRGFAAGPIRWGVLRQLLIVAAVIVSVFGVTTWVLASPWYWIAMDFRPFFLASQTPVSTLYQGPDYNFLYPPTAIPELKLLSLADFWTGYFALGLISAGCFFWAAKRLAGIKIAALSLVSMPALQGVIWGQIPMLATAGVLAAMLLRPNAKGFVIGLLITLKPQLLFMAPVVFIVRGETRTAVMIGIGVSLSVATSLLLFGIEPWRDWFSAVPHFRNFLAGSVATFGMISVPGIALRSGLPTLPFLAAGLILGGWLTWRARGVSDPVILTAVIGGASILAAPYVMIHDAIILMPAAVSCLLRGRLASAVTGAVVYAAAIIPFVVPIFLVLGLLDRSARGEQRAAYASC